MRRTPYTSAGIKRCQCVRCGGPGYAQWQICADAREYRVICADCDIELNALVLRWANVPDRRRKLAVYKAKVRRAA